MLFSSMPLESTLPIPTRNAIGVAFLIFVRGNTYACAAVYLDFMDFEFGEDRKSEVDSGQSNQSRSHVSPNLPEFLLLG